MARRTVSLLMVFQLLGLAGLPQVVQAVIVGTAEVIEKDDRAERLERLDELLAREKVREQFVALGVDPDEAGLRVASLTDSQLSRLEAGLGDLPAGGDSVIAVIGVVFLVLLILEFVGVTNVFTKI
jgi:hypothetical protein